MFVFTGLVYCGEISSYRTKESVAVLVMEFWMGTVFIHGIILIMGQTKIVVSAVWIKCITYAHNDVTSYPISTMWMEKIKGYAPDLPSHLWKWMYPFSIFLWKQQTWRNCAAEHVNWIQPNRQTQWWYYLFQAGPASITWSPFFCKVSDGVLHVIGIQ